MYAADIAELLDAPGGEHQTKPAPSVLVPDGGAGNNLSASFGGAYDGADRFDRTLALWAPPIMSADAEIIPEKGTVDARVRDVIRNDAYVASAANLHRDNIVGSTFLLNAKPATKVLWGREDETWEVEFQEEVETKFNLIAESPDNWFDAARLNTFTELVRLAVGVHVMGGEVLASVEWIQDEPDRLFSTAVQMIDLDRLSTPFTEVANQSIRGGVQRNRRGAPVGYHIRNAHPTDYMAEDNWKWTYVPVRKPWGRLQMLHIYEQTRPDQTRGMAEMVSALKEMRITKKFRDVVLQNAVVQSSYAATIESDLPTDAIFAMLGGGNLTDENVSKAMGSYMKGYLGNVAKYVGNSRNMHLDGVKVPHLPPGSKFNLTPAGSGGPLGTDFEQSLLRYIAASLGVSYEQLSRDYTQTNYSSARAAMGETEKFMASRKKLVADRFATAIYRLWLEEAISKGMIETLKRRNVPNFYEGMNADAYTACEWIGASRGQLDELKETQAAILRINNNISTDEAEIARLGGDWRRVKRQRSREKKVDEELSITPPSQQNMLNAATGSPTDPAETDAETANKNKKAKAK